VNFWGWNSSNKSIADRIIYIKTSLVRHEVLDENLSPISEVFNVISDMLEKRAYKASNEVLEYRDLGYPYYYSIDIMVRWYGDVNSKYGSCGLTVS
jgi:hypothetical protein